MYTASELVKTDLCGSIIGSREIFMEGPCVCGTSLNCRYICGRLPCDACGGEIVTDSMIGLQISVQGGRIVDLQAGVWEAITEFVDLAEGIELGWLALIGVTAGAGVVWIVFL